MPRGLKSTLFLLVVLAGLVAYIYFVDRNQPIGDTEELENVFSNVAADQIEEIEIKAEDGQRTRLTRSGESWNIVEPVQAPSDAGELSSITSSLADIDIQRVVDEKPPDLKRFSLDPPRLEVGFRTKGEKELKRLHIGQKVPASEELYARLPDSPRVFLISGFLDGTFNKNTFALRDKRILSFERDKVETVELTSGDTRIQLARMGTEWSLVKPIAARGDYGTIQGIVERLASVQMQGIVADQATDLKQYGLDRPTATMVVGTGSARATLLLGRTENALVFAKDAARPMIFTVAPTVKDDTFKPVDELRRKDLFDSRSFTATRVELKRGNETFTFEKTKGKAEGDPEVWRDAAGKDVDAAKMEDMLGRVTGLRAESFEAAAPAAMKSPVLVATVRFDQNKTETVAFGRAGSDVFATRADEPGAAKLAAASFDEAMKALDALK